MDYYLTKSKEFINFQKRIYCTLLEDTDTISDYVLYNNIITKNLLDYIKSNFSIMYKSEKDMHAEEIENIFDVMINKFYSIYTKFKDVSYNDFEYITSKTDCGIYFNAHIIGKINRNSFSEDDLINNLCLNNEEDYEEPNAIIIFRESEIPYDIFYKQVKLYIDKLELDCPIIICKDINFLRIVYTKKSIKEDIFKNNKIKLEKILFNKLKHLKDNDSILFESPYIDYKNIFKIFKFNNIKKVYMTLYRHDDELIKHILDLADSGIIFNIYFEFKARGDEKRNYEFYNILGHHPNIATHYNSNMKKIHIKAMVCITYDNKFITHISSGNYNIRNSKTYTDYQFITKNKNIGKEVHSLFRYIFANDNFDIKKYSNLLISPYNTKDYIRDSIINSEEVFIKTNGITESYITNAINISYHNKKKFNIISRSTSIRLSGVKTYSKIGEFLEHGRMYKFDNDILIGSADLMSRNINDRFELLVKIPNDTNLILCDDKYNYISDIDKYIEYSINSSNWSCEDSKWKKEK